MSAGFELRGEAAVEDDRALALEQLRQAGHGGHPAGQTPSRPVPSRTVTLMTAATEHAKSRHSG
jgi:hypothetical protein